MGLDIATHPVQLGYKRSSSGKMPQSVTLKAYEVYCHVHSPQPAMITDGCRGGFSVGELIAFLYASSFPKSEWAMRVREALAGMEI